MHRLKELEQLLFYTKNRASILTYYYEYANLYLTTVSPISVPFSR